MGMIEQAVLASKLIDAHIISRSRVFENLNFWILKQGLFVVGPTGHEFVPKVDSLVVTVESLRWVTTC